MGSGAGTGRGRRQGGWVKALGGRHAGIVATKQQVVVAQKEDVDEREQGPPVGERTGALEGQLLAGAGVKGRRATAAPIEADAEGVTTRGNGHREFLAATQSADELPIEHDVIGTEGVGERGGAGEVQGSGHAVGVGRARVGRWAKPKSSRSLASGRPAGKAGKGARGTGPRNAGVGLEGTKQILHRCGRVARAGGVGAGLRLGGAGDGGGRAKISQSFFGGRTVFVLPPGV